MKNNMAIRRQTYGRACKKKKGTYTGHCPSQHMRTVLQILIWFAPLHKSDSPHRTRSLVWFYSLIYRRSLNHKSDTAKFYSAIYIAERSRGTFVVIKLLPFNTLQTLSIFIGLQSTPCWRETCCKFPRLQLTPLQLTRLIPGNLEQSAVHLRLFSHPRLHFNSAVIEN